MNRKQLEMIHRIIRNSSHPELSGVLRAAMARNRKEAIQEIRNQSTVLFEHLIPLLALKKKGMAYPTNWPDEIHGCLARIHAKNGSKRSKKRWLEAEDIARLLGEELIPNIQRAVLQKLKSFSAPVTEAVQGYMFNLFRSRADLTKMGVTLSYVGDQLTISIDGEVVQ